MDPLGWIAWLLAGAIIGWLFCLASPGRSLGLFGDMVAGIIGAYIGGFAFSLFRGPDPAFDGWSVLAAMAGAGILLGLLRFVARPSLSS